MRRAWLAGSWPRWLRACARCSKASSCASAAALALTSPRKPRQRRLRLTAPRDASFPALRAATRRGGLGRRSSRRSDKAAASVRCRSQRWLRVVGEHACVASRPWGLLCSRVQLFTTWWAVRRSSSCAQMMRTIQAAAAREAELQEKVRSCSSPRVECLGLRALAWVVEAAARAREAELQKKVRPRRA